MLLLKTEPMLINGGVHCSCTRERCPAHYCYKSLPRSRPRAAREGTPADGCRTCWGGAVVRRLAVRRLVPAVKNRKEKKIGGRRLRFGCGRWRLRKTERKKKRSRRGETGRQWRLAGGSVACCCCSTVGDGGKRRRRRREGERKKKKGRNERREPSQRKKKKGRNERREPSQRKKKTPPDALLAASYSSSRSCWNVLEAPVGCVHGVADSIFVTTEGARRFGEGGHCCCFCFDMILKAIISSLLLEASIA